MDDPLSCISAHMQTASQTSDKSGDTSAIQTDAHHASRLTL